MISVELIVFEGCTIEAEATETEDDDYECGIIGGAVSYELTAATNAQNELLSIEALVELEQRCLNDSATNQKILDALSLAYRAQDDFE